MHTMYVGIIDTSTKVVLTVTTNRAVGNFLAECTPDTALIPNINQVKMFPHFLSSFFLRIHPLFRAQSTGDDYVRWTWAGDTSPFAQTAKGVISDSVRAKAGLVTAKRDAIEYVMQGVSHARKFHASGVLFQEEINLNKKYQAQRFKDAGYDDGRLMEFPYVVHYADVSDISLKQAADEILFKSQLSDARLANTELIRWRYFAMIKAVKNPNEFPAIREAFVRDSYMNAMVA